MFLLTVDMTEELKTLLENSVRIAVKETVNGKIDAIRDDLKRHAENDDVNMTAIRLHIAETQPYLQGAAGLGLLWKGLIAIGSLAAAWLAVKSVFHT